MSVGEYTQPILLSIHCEYKIPATFYYYDNLVVEWKVHDAINYGYKIIFENDNYVTFGNSQFSKELQNQELVICFSLRDFTSRFVIEVSSSQSPTLAR